MLNTQSCSDWRRSASSQIRRPDHQQEVDCFCTCFSLCTIEGLQLPWILRFITDVYYSYQLWFLLTGTGGGRGDGGAPIPSGLSVPRLFSFL